MHAKQINKQTDEILILIAWTSQGSALYLCSIGRVIDACMSVIYNHFFSRLFYFLYGKNSILNCDGILSLRSTSMIMVKHHFIKYFK